MIAPAPAQRFGYRGRALTLVGLVWILIGAAVILHPYEHLAPRILLHEHIPVPVRVVLWVGAGVCALVTSWWPPGADRFGFMALVIPAAIRAGSYGWTAFLGFVTHNQLGNHNAWIPAAAWAVIVAFVQLLAAWPEPADRHLEHTAGSDR
ncbi:MAG TPA: hypothetical protein VF049_04460 [Nocardioidaceae bacterium]